MIDDSNIILISYPSGGFGNFLFHVLTEFTNETHKPTQKTFEFSANGNSHQTEKYTKVYFQDPTVYRLPERDQSVKLILCDNGINNASYTKIRQHFPSAPIVRCVISKLIRPVIYQTCVVKAMDSSLPANTHDHVINNWSDYNEDYAKRENYTLLYDNWPFKWDQSSDSNVINFDLETLIKDPIGAISWLANKLNLTLIDNAELDMFCKEWQHSNSRYFEIYYKWQAIEHALDNNTNLDVTHIADLHEQGYINYQLQQKFNIIIPVYDYRNWFNNTLDMAQLSNEENTINN